MVNYRRCYIKGGKYFFTVTLNNRKSDLLVEHIDLLRESMRTVQLNYSYEIDAVVILPDHIHTIWQLPRNDANYSLRWRKIKSCFTQGLLRFGYQLEKNARGECNIWQKRFWEHTIEDEKDFEAHVNYIHYNPVKHKLVTNVLDWPYSSFHRYVRAGLLPASWGGLVNDDEGCCYGE
jgi:putative transposase